jgi:hypothetical protein
MKPNGAAEIKSMVDAALPVSPNGHDPKPAPPPAGDRDLEEAVVIARLAETYRKSPIQYDRLLKPEADELGCKSSTLDRRVKELLRAKDREAGTARLGAGRALQIPEVEPWPGAVDGASLLDEIATIVRRHVVTSAGAPEAIALWGVQTYTIDAAFIAPRLAITSPERRCGKTTLLTILGEIVARPLSTANLTAAATFRVIESVHPTLLVDEADSFLSENEELRGIINAGHCRKSSTVVRVIELPEGHEIRGFDVFGPMAIAAIGKLPGTIEDRAIKIVMRRRRQDEEVERLRLDRVDEFQPVARRCQRWSLDHLPRLRAADPIMPADLHDRAADNWRPLLAIADLAGGDWPRLGRRAAALLSCPEDAESAREMLLADLKSLFEAEPSGVLFTRQILDKLHAMEDRPWPEWRKEKPITSHQLSALLKPLRVLPNAVRRGADHGKGYRREDLEDAFTRYLPSA